MRKLIQIAGVILGLLQFMSLPASAQVIGNARLSLMQGDVVIQTPDTGTEWGAASINTPMTPGMKLWVPENGRAEVQFVGGSFLRAAGNTEVDVTNLKMDNAGNIIQMGLPQGRTYIYYTGSPGGNSVFQVDTPIASVKVYGASKFMVDVYENGYTEVSVISGSVYAESQTGNTTVEAGNMLSLGTDQAAEISPVRQADSWVSWNQSRDSAFAQIGPSRKYLPPTIGVYGSDLDSNGRWVYAANYGYVWTPFNVAVDWAPYRVGRWCWIGGDYVWVSYEPWGWVPYHYGRWSFVVNIGWCWVPPALTAFYWSPGFVAWIQTPTYVSWVPLAPGEIYYGHGYYGPYSVNIANININRISVTNVYVNARVTNAVTVVSRQTFLTGRPLRLANVPANPFRAGLRPSIGRPDIKPVRATALPMPTKAVPQRILPPREIQAKVARIEHRQVALNRDVSVFKPGQRVTSMPTRRVEHPPSASIQRAQRPELGRPSTESREAVKPPAQKGEAHGMVRPPAQRPQVAAPPSHREQMGRPSEQRKEVGPQHRETGVAPSFGREPGTVEKPKTGPPVHREELNKSQTHSTVKPPVQRSESRTQPMHREPISPLPEQRGGTGGQSIHREMGAAPRFEDSGGSLPSHRKEINAPPVHSTVRSPVRTETASPPVHRQEMNGPQTHSTGRPAAPKKEPGKQPY